MAEKSIKEAGKQGSLVWQFARWRRIALTALFDDLVDAESEGFPDQDCEVVRQALEKCATRVADIGDRSVHYHMERLVIDYEKWNNPTGKDAKTAALRRKRMKSLRKRKRKLANRTTRRAHVIESGLDKSLIDAQYKTLEELTKSLPDTFKKLAEVVARYGTTGGA